MPRTDLIRRTWTVGALVRRHARVVLDTLGMEWVEHKGWLDFTFIVQGTPGQWARLSEWIEQVGGDK